MTPPRKQLGDSALRAYAALRVERELAPARKLQLLDEATALALGAPSRRRCSGSFVADAAASAARARGSARHAPALPLRVGVRLDGRGGCGANGLWAGRLPDLTGGGAVYLARPAPGSSETRIR